MFSPYLPLSDKFASLFMPLCQCTWGRYKGENMSNYTWTDSKWRPVPVKRDSCLIPNWSEPTFVEPKIERKFATEYSTAGKWVSKS